MAKAYQYDANHYYVEEVEDYGLLPNNATHTAPALQSGFIPRWNGNDWEQVENHVGKQGYVDGAPFTVTEYGPLPEGWSEIKPEPEKTLERIQAEFEGLIQARLDAFARTLTYDNILSACTYANSKNPVFALEGQYCIEARDNTWSKAYELLNVILPELAAGERSMPEWTEIETQLPELAWPAGSRGREEKGAL